MEHDIEDNASGAKKKNIEADDPRLVFMPETDILKAGGTVLAMHDRWFCVHPEKGLVFWRQGGRGLSGASPQCNSNQAVAEQVLLVMYPWAELKFYELVLQPIRVQDYC